MLMSITDIIVESYRLYKNNVKKFFPYILLTFIPSALIVIARFILTYFAPGASLGTIGLSFLSFLLVALLLSAVGFWFSKRIHRKNIRFYRERAWHCQKNLLASCRGNDSYCPSCIGWHDPPHYPGYYFHALVCFFLCVCHD